MKKEYVEFLVCADCRIAIANDDYTGLDDDQAEHVRQCIEYLSRDHYLIADGTEQGFSHRRCECCDELPGNRYLVLGVKP